MTWSKSSTRMALAASVSCAVAGALYLGHLGGERTARVNLERRLQQFVEDNTCVVDPPPGFAKRFPGDPLPRSL